MRSIVVLAILAIFALTACAGQAEPTAEPPTALPTSAAPPLDTPNPDATAVPAPDNIEQPTAQTNESVATLEAQAGEPLNVVIPGTMIFPEETEAVGPQSSLLTTFQMLEYNQTGGAGNAALTIILLPDGTLTRDGVTGSIPLVEVQAVLEALDKVHFFTVTGTFEGPNTPPDGYRFALNVDTTDASRGISASEGYTPPELQSLFFAISRLGLEPFSYEPG
ncbi:MAG: hypothetical protein IT320_27000 [Anaerolineae bacterium]|nr:hypothetical protein [Anaerolineae bacterium]